MLSGGEGIQGNRATELNYRRAWMPGDRDQLRFQNSTVVNRAWDYFSFLIASDYLWNDCSKRGLFGCRPNVSSGRLRRAQQTASQTVVYSGSVEGRPQSWQLDTPSRCRSQSTTRVLEHSPLVCIVHDAMHTFPYKDRGVANDPLPHRKPMTGVIW